MCLYTVLIWCGTVICKISSNIRLHSECMAWCRRIVLKVPLLSIFIWSSVVLYLKFSVRFMTTYTYCLLDFGRPDTADWTPWPQPTSIHRWDGTQVCGSCRPSTTTQLLDRMSECLADVATWMHSNRLSCVEESLNGSAVFWVTGHFSTPPENWTVHAFLQLTPCLSNYSTAAWLTFTFPAAFCCGRNLEVYWL